MADHVGDDPAAVARNRRSLADGLGVPLVWMRQVHGATVATVDASAVATAPVADALVCTGTGVGIGVLVADCVPVLLADADASVAAAVHVGRRGLVASVLPRAVETMVGVGAAPQRIRAWVGPAICGRCYEVPAHLRAAVDELAPGTATTTRWGSPGLDVRAGVHQQLSASGVAVEAMDPRCTYEAPELYSHRRDGVTGRFAGVIVLHRVLHGAPDRVERAAAGAAAGEPADRH